MFRLYVQFDTVALTDLSRERLLLPDDFDSIRIESLVSRAITMVTNDNLNAGSRPKSCIAESCASP